MILIDLESRDTPSRLVISAAGIVYAESGAFQPFDSYTGALDVSLAGDLNGNGHEDIAIGAGEGGGPRVTVIDSHTRQTLLNFFAFEPTFRGGVRVGSIDNTLLVGAGPGGAPVVAEFSAVTGDEIRRQFYGPEWDRGGVYLDSWTQPLVTPQTLGSGFPVYLDLAGLRGFEAQFVARESYRLLEPVGVQITTTRPTLPPSDYLHVYQADLDFVPIPITGLTTDTLRTRQPGSYRSFTAIVDVGVPINYLPSVIAHEVLHAVGGLEHSPDPMNLMHAPAALGGFLTPGQIAEARSFLRRWS